MNNGSQGFGDYLELIRPKITQSFSVENRANSSPGDGNMSMGLPDMVIPPSSSDLCLSSAKNDVQDTAREPKKESIHVGKPHFLAAPSFLQTFDPNALPGLIVPSLGSSGQQFPNFSTSTNSIADFGISPLASLGSTASHNVITPVDIRELLGKSQRTGKVPVDIRKLAGANRWMSAGRGRGTKRKTVAGLPSKHVELGVSARLTKLERLIRKPEKDLTTLEKAEKKNILRLEKNRRAAAVSRERKKRYIRSLEERNVIMAKHLDALERENSKLRALLKQRNGSVTLPPRLPSLALSPFTYMSLEPKTPRRKIKKERHESDTSPFENLYLSDVRNTSGGFEIEGTIEIPTLCTTYDRRKSKKLKLM